MTFSGLWGVYGAGGAGRGILPLLRRKAKTANANLVFIDDALPNRIINGHNVLTWREFLDIPAKGRRACLAVSHPAIRSELAKKCTAADVQLLSAIAENVTIMDEVVIGEGACLSPFVTVGPNTQIGKFFHANLYSYVEHDCIVGDFVTFAPGAKCNGSIVIEDQVYVGSGAIIKQGARDRPLVIGAKAIIGMGAIVTKDVAPGATVIGNPARPL